MFHHSRLNTEFTWPPLVNFLEPEEPSIYGYGYAPRYISELVANQGELCENITIAFTLSKKTFTHAP